MVEGLLVVRHIFELVFVEVYPYFTHSRQLEPREISKPRHWLLKFRDVERHLLLFLSLSKNTQKALKN